ncbi:MAG: hypothetical protein JOZ15_20550 [Acidobacteria bacterium]|nr:hypothetical protein [Acidobacteriota bacterium]
MKRTHKKLRLNRDTLRSLTPTALGTAAGNGTYTCRVNGTNTCTLIEVTCLGCVTATCPSFCKQLICDVTMGGC